MCTHESSGAANAGGECCEATNAEGECASTNAEGECLRLATSYFKFFSFLSFFLMAVVSA